MSTTFSHLQNESDRKRDKIESQIASMTAVLDNHKESLYFIQERMSEYVYPTDIPLQLKQAERNHKQKITELSSKLESLRNEREKLLNLGIMERSL
jgi:hypothetical protein